MQSLASLMSVKPADIGNLDDFNESDEEENKKSVTATGKQANAGPSVWSSADSSSSMTFFPFPSSFLCCCLLASAVVPHTLTRPNRPAPPPPDKLNAAGPSFPASGTLSLGLCSSVLYFTPSFVPHTGTSAYGE